MATTWAQALADPHVPIHWVLVLHGAGAPVRYADTDLEISGHQYIGALVVRTLPATVIDAYTSQSSSPNAVVSLLPTVTGHAAGLPLRPYDDEAVYQLPFIGWRAQLYRWAEGTPWSQAEGGAGPLVNGFVYEPSLDPDGTLHLTIVDATLRHNTNLPRRFVTPVRWPNSYGGDRGMGYPILFNSFTRVPCPMISVDGATYEWAGVADGTITSIDQAYYDGTALATETLQVLTDGRGDTMSTARVTHATDGLVADKQCTVTGTGYSDDALGTYTGTASALITHPADQIRYLLTQFCGVADESLDIPSFVEMRSDLAGWTTSIQVLGDYTSNLFALFADICPLLRSAVFAEKGKFVMRHIKFDRPPVLAIKEGESLISVQPIEQTDREKLITQLVIQYAWRWIQKSEILGWTATLEIGPTDYKPFADNLWLLRGESSSSIERNRLIQTRCLQTEATADRVAAKIADLHSKPRAIVKCRVTRDAGHVLRILDVIMLSLSGAPSRDGLGWVNKRFLVTGITYGLDADDLQLLEC